ncbi:MAG: PP0621 family protein [Thiolinea sp.]
MSRLLFLLVLLVVGYLLVKSWQRKLDEAKKSNKKNGFGRLIKKSQIVKCEHCELHVPEAEAVIHGGKHFCSLEHAQQAQLEKNNR